VKKNRFSAEQVVTIVRKSRAHGVAAQALNYGVSPTTLSLGRGPVRPV